MNEAGLKIRSSQLKPKIQYSLRFLDYVCAVQWYTSLNRQIQSLAYTQNTPIRF